MYPRFASALEALADGVTALVLGFATVLLGFAVVLVFAFCLAAVVFVVELVAAGRAVVVVAGLLAVAGFTVRLEVDEVLAGLAVVLLVV